MSYVKITNFAIKDSTNAIIRGTEHDDEYNAIEASFTAQPSATQTLTNKTIALGSNTVSGTFAQLNTAITDADLARTDAANTFTGVQTLSSQPILSTLTASSAVATDASKGLVSVTNTGTGNNVLATSPTITGATLTTAALNGSLGATTPSTVVATTITGTDLTTTGNTILGNASTDTLNVGNGGLVKDASGNTFIGTSVSSLSTDARLGLQGGIDIFYSVTPSAYKTAISCPNGNTVINAVGDSAGIQFGTTAVGGTIATERMRIDAAGNVGIGVTPTASTSGGKIIQATGATIQFYGASEFDMQQNSYYASGYKYLANGFASNYVQYSGNHAWQTAPNNVSGAGAACTFTQAMTLDASGNLYLNTTTPYTAEKFSVVATVADWSAVVRNTNASPFGHVVNYTGAAPNGTGNGFYHARDTGGLRAEIRSNGGLANFSANNVNLSDERTKKDITNAGSYLDKICAIPVRTFLYKDQTDTQLNLGVIAQEVEAIAPELVDVSGFGETPEDGIPLKTIYQTDLQYALMKCIQEQQALITSLTARLEVLEAK